MISKTYVQTMAAYNAWQNDWLIKAVQQLTPEQRSQDLGSFFGSIEATMNHLLWADQIWLHRLAGAPKPQAKSIPESTSQFADFAELIKARKATDQRLKDWTAQVSEAELAGELRWFSGATGKEMSNERARCITHMFNHQTHHRGQIHGMLTQLGVATGTTDLVFMPASYLS